MSNELMVAVEHDTLVLGPVRVTFQRTLRIPESGLHDLPPGLGAFPVRRVEDYPDTVPAQWLARGGVMLPIYQREAMWLSFDSDEPAALQVATGKVCALSGEAWSPTLVREPQNYVALPDQPWLDGINAGDGFIRQFVAVPLGLGATVEGQVTGAEASGGVQLRAVGLTPAALRRWRERPPLDYLVFAGAPVPMAQASGSMGLGAGGRMRQEIYADERALADYAQDRSWRVHVHLCSPAQWTAITGERAPDSPVDRESYVRQGLPWFAYYDEDREDLAASQTLAEVRTVAELLGHEDAPFTPADPSTVLTLKDGSADPVQPVTW